MISSMTGFGSASIRTTDKRFQVDIKSVNSKQLDASFRMPQQYKELEIALRQELMNKIGRGKVEVWITTENLNCASSINFNIQLLESYKKQFIEIGNKLNLGEPQDWYSLLLRMPEVMKNENEDAEENEKDALLEAFNQAVNELIKFRENEGQKLFDFFITKINNIDQLLLLIPSFETERIAKIRERLEENLSKLDSIEYEKGRLEQELIFYIEKLDITEEKVRLKAHLSYFLETLQGASVNASEGKGKKLGFICQEIGREINTLGSKSNHAEMQKVVVRMKDELEQIKEQILNVL